MGAIGFRLKIDVLVGVWVSPAFAEEFRLMAISYCSFSGGEGDSDRNF